MLKRVVVFDFGGVLFHAIRRPSWCQDKSVSGIIPEEPGDEWYLGENLRFVREIAAQENAYVCCWLGASWDNKNQVKRLLENVGVWFDEYVSMDGEDELACRVGLVGKLLKEFHDLRQLEWWVGPSQKPEQLKRAVEQLGVRLLVRQVNGRPPKVLRGALRLR